MFGQNLPFSLAKLSSFPSSSWIAPPPVSLATASPSSPIACSFFPVQSQIWYIRLGKASAEFEHNAVNCFSRWCSTPRGWLPSSSGWSLWHFLWNRVVWMEHMWLYCWNRFSGQSVSCFNFSSQPLPSLMVLCHHWRQTQNLFRQAIKVLRIFDFFPNEGPPSPFQEPLVQKGDSGVF